jgi:hypothetical protein
MRRFAILLSLLLPLRALASDPMRFEVYPLGDADLDATLEAVRLFVGNEGHVAADTRQRRLLVATTAERHARIAELFQRLSGPPRNVLIEVQIRTAGRRQESEASLDASGDVAIGRDGLSFGKIRLSPRVAHRTATRAGGATQTLLVGSGREASLRVGESVPYLEWISDVGVRNGHLQTRLAWQQVGAFLVVQPTIIGDGPTLRVRIAPELRGLVDGRPERVRFSALATEVVARDGEPIRLGAFGQHAEFYSRYLVGRGADGAAESLDIQLIPRIQPLAAPPR